METQSEVAKKIAALGALVAALREADRLGAGAERPEEWRIASAYMMFAITNELAPGAARSADGKQYRDAADADRNAKAFEQLAATLMALGPRGAWADSAEEAREAAVKMLGTMRDVLSAGGAAIEAQRPVLELLGAIAGLQQGHKTWLTAGLQARPGPRPEDVSRLGDLALACAAVTLLCDGGKELPEALQEVALAARAVLPASASAARRGPTGYLDEWRTALTKGRKPQPARQIYDEALAAVKRAQAAELRAMTEKGIKPRPDFARWFYREQAAGYLDQLRSKGHLKSPRGE